MKLSAVAIDDEPLALEIIKQYCTQINEIDLTQTFDNAVAGLDYINRHRPSLLFIDIDMPDINGIDLVNQLQSRPMIIFTTAYKEFALEGFELEAIDYLLKPFSFDRFEKAFQKALSRYQIGNTADELEPFFVYSEYRMIKIDFRDIVYIESLDDYIKIHLSNSKPVMTLMSLKKIALKLSPKKFIRVHRSYIVATDHLASLSGRKSGFLQGWSFL
ncbi:LytR/AlgR family response regulator transcription factor [Niabella hibiscisoli]|uniref:LytR/AlgR family response regulator transcription factor n=1 Tax=Niabella hibiscisoli TaxID=1825928 RepID=UPI001F1190C7|nr:LytTR family DNA-binding domain-containing protein [Niabella hibiscisoli]MCH5717014.1 LytTR family DNA-binding domain-containing protein [Niabella hibiscisoli]